MRTLFKGVMILLATLFFAGIGLILKNILSPDTMNALVCISIGWCMGAVPWGATGYWLRGASSTVPDAKTQVLNYGDNRCIIYTLPIGRHVRPNELMERDNDRYP